MVVARKIEVYLLLIIFLFLNSCWDSTISEKSDRQLFVEYLDSIDFYKTDSVNVFEQINEKITDSLSIASLNLVLYRISVFYGEEYRVVLFDKERRKGYFLATVDCGQPVSTLVGDKNDSTCGQILAPLCTYLADMRFLNHCPVKANEIDMIIDFLENSTDEGCLFSNIGDMNKEAIIEQLSGRFNITVYENEKLGMAPVDSVANIDGLTNEIASIIDASSFSGGMRMKHNLVFAKWQYLNSYIFFEDAIQKKYYIKFRQIDIIEK